MQATVLITTYNRDALLRYGLESILKQNLTDIGILVLDDGDSHAGDVCLELGVSYISLREPGNWRIPGFALNVGAKQITSEIMMISCAEILHLDADILQHMKRASEQDPKALVTVTGKYDDGKFLQQLPALSEDVYNALPALNTKLPFLMALRRQDYIDIGGYDEDFTGQAFDDNDIVTRLLGYGYHYEQLPARIVHLWHTTRQRGREVGLGRRVLHNRNLYETRKTIQRNVGREWGVV